MFDIFYRPAKSTVCDDGQPSSPMQEPRGIRPKGEEAGKEGKKGQMNRHSRRTQDETQGEDEPRASKDDTGGQRKSGDGEHRAAGQEQGANSSKEKELHGGTDKEGKMKRDFAMAKRDAKEKEEQLQAAKKDMAAMKKQAEQQIAELQKHLESVGRQNWERDQQIQRQTNSIRSIRDEARRETREKEQLQATKKDMEATAKQMERQIEDMRKHLTVVEQRNREMDQHIQHLTNNTHTIQDEARRAEAKRLQTVKLLEERTTELKGAQAFLTKADSLSGADVIGMVESLNSEILQVSAFMADTLKCGYQPMATEEVEQMAAQASGVLGIRMVQLLRSKQPDGDPMLIQIALQAYMVRLCKEMTSSWDLHNQQCHHILATIYARIQQTEDQAVSGRWRALTRAQVKHPADRDSQEWSMAGFANHLINLLVVAGWPESGSKARNIFVEAFGNRLSVIGKLVIQLNKAVGEDITSGDLEAFFVPPNAAFNPAIMDDAYADERPRRGKTSVEERVVATTDMGLQRMARRYREGKHECETMIVLKPKVVLYSALEDVVNVEGAR